MLVVLPFCARDKVLAVRLAEWIAELGGVAAHDCLLAVHKDTDSAGVIEPLAKAFGRVAEFAITDDMIVEREQHAYAANVMWKRVANHIADMNASQPWLWLEPDATPITADWLDKIAAVYAQAGKPFLHCLVETPRGRSNSGCGVYPAKVRDYTDRLWELSNVSWDVLLYPDFAPHTAYTTLIQDIGFMSDGKTLPTFSDSASLSILNPAAALFHRCKDFSLGYRLRERALGSALPVGKEPAPVAAISAEAVPPAAPSAPIPLSQAEEIIQRLERIEALIQTPGFNSMAAAPHPIRTLLDMRGLDAGHSHDLQFETQTSPDRLSSTTPHTPSWNAAEFEIGIVKWSRFGIPVGTSILFSRCEPAMKPIKTTPDGASNAAPTSKPAARRKKSQRSKKTRTPSEQAAIDARMAKARAARKVTA